MEMTEIGLELNTELENTDLFLLLERAENIVAAAVGAAGVTCMIPIPFADAPILVAEQVAMMASICAVFKMELDEEALIALATAAIGAGGAVFLGRWASTSLIKLIPGVGSVTGTAISAGTASVITFALGGAFIEVCKNVEMGKLSIYDVESQKGIELLKKEFKRRLKF